MEPAPPAVVVVVAFISGKSTMHCRGEVTFLFSFLAYCIVIECMQQAKVAEHIHPSNFDGPTPSSKDGHPCESSVASYPPI